MPHIDEGRLHAYLDGASAPEVDRETLTGHLESCEDCRNRLTEARAVREEVRRLLGKAAPPAQEAPSFEELKARAAGEAAVEATAAPARARRPARGSILPLAWAASIAVAGGAGWMGRQLLVEQQEKPIPAARSAASPALAESETADRIRAGAGAARNEREESRVRRDEERRFEGPERDAERGAGESPPAVAEAARKAAVDRAPSEGRTEPLEVAGGVEEDRVDREGAALLAQALPVRRVAGCYRLDAAWRKDVLPPVLRLTSRPAREGSSAGPYVAEVVAEEGAEPGASAYVLEWELLNGDSVTIAGSGPRGSITVKLAIEGERLEGSGRQSRVRDELADSDAAGGEVRLSPIPCGE